MNGILGFFIKIFIITALIVIVFKVYESAKNSTQNLESYTYEKDDESYSNTQTGNTNKKYIPQRQPSIFQDPSKYRLKFPYPTDWKEIGGGYYGPGGEYEHDIPRPRKRSFSESENDFESGFEEYNGQGPIYTGKPCPEGVDIGESYPCEMYGIEGICTCEYPN